MIDDPEKSPPTDGSDPVPRRGGAGLYPPASAHSRGRSSGALLGIGSVVLTLALGGLLVMLNPSLTSGAAGGTADQIGALPVAGSAKGAAPQPPPGSAAEEGRTIIGRRGCGSCHIIPGIAGATASVGPNLAGVASRKKIAGGAVDNTGPQDLAKWILDPPALKPGTAMPKVGLTEDEAAKAAAYLELLK